MWCPQMGLAKEKMELFLRHDSRIERKERENSNNWDGHTNFLAGQLHVKYLFD